MDGGKYAVADVRGLQEIEDYALRLGAAIAAFGLGKSPADRDRIRRDARPFRDQVRVRWLAALNAEVELTPSERRSLERLDATPGPARRASAGKVVIVLKATRLCNLRCAYCNAWAEGPGQVMTFSTAARLVRDVLLSPGISQVDFVWHGGEIMLLKPKFFRKLIWLQQRYRRPGQAVTNSLQTNATMVSDEWLGLICALNLGVGVSIDGPPQIHDQRRKTATGEGSSAQVLAGLARLRSAGVDHGVLVVVDRPMSELPIPSLLGYFADEGLGEIDFLNIVPGNDEMAKGDRPADFISFREFCVWMREVYRIWRQDFRDRLKIRFLDDLITTVSRSAQPTNCYFGGDCLERIFTIEANGSVAPCDKFVGGPRADYGSFHREPLDVVVARNSALEARSAEAGDMSATQACRWSATCRGGCPHDRIAARLFDPVFDAGCCGLAELLDDIAEHECGSGSTLEPTPADLASGEQHPIGVSHA